MLGLVERVPRRVLYAAGGVVAVLVVAAVAFLVLHRGSAPAALALTPSPSPTPAVASAAPTPTPRKPQAVRHARLVIPKIKVDAHIEHVGVDSHNNMAVPVSPWDVGWYDRGPQPGDAGDAVLDGHLDWYTTGPAVFWNLKNLRLGDQIIVWRDDGKRVVFVIDSINSYPYYAHPAGLFATSGKPEISLITCSGTWDAATQNYQQRLVINAHVSSA